MFFMNAILSLWVLGIACVMFLVVLLYMPTIGRYHGKVVEAETRKNSFLIETVHGMRTVKSLALEGSKRRGWDARGATAVRANRNLALVANQPQTILQPLEKLTYSGTLLLGCYMALSTDQAALAGSLVAFTMLASRATQPFVQIAGMLQQVQEVRGAVAQVASIVNIPPEELRSDHGLRPRFQGHISFEDVSFRYPGAQNKALDRVTVDIPRGSVVGVMGRSGSGKTTVTRLLQGLHQDYDGLIKIDGVDLRQMDISHLRSNLGVVLQDNFLFSGTVRENIASARADASFEEVIEAARMAGAEEFIERLPRGYDTYLAEGSTNISGGQRQRIAIARALLINPPILILDEATSALDPDSEAIINANLTRISEGRTMVIISHRLTSLVDCDIIVVMERGRVYDVGTHEELLQRCDIYRHLWFQQNRHQNSGVPNERALSGPDTRD
ncbi:peptidase domain-containing ABC transporter [Azospirillum sp. B4]|uniref:peptidase domain-containing ABC transporter n=1 Tax=Azospirillum sp. B4 TaxID=95605 RepID=UPI00207874BD|nr:peptidase domain-containing ABC transporter [Azospirillum sp. B4]